ncbi:melatonin receptor type 1B-like [Littorina saxatilis]|uniref:G-protein coupled receptors family 1 profile domain-containing protein n=1 Tax=Littorina saxatilis TaxID=31220 RepID=A0AAN9B451_9CAEN
MNDTETYTGEELPLWARALFGTLHVCTSLNGVLGSALILTSLTRDRLFKTAACTYTAYMANLVITDLYFQVYYFPSLTVGLVLGRYPVLNETHCVFNAYLAMSCYSIFLLTLTAISFDRYVRVCHDNVYRHYFSRKTSVAVCLAIWTAGCLVPLPAIMKDSLGFDSKAHVCFTKNTATSSASLPYLVTFTFSVLASGFFSFRIYTVYRAARRRVEQHSEGVRGPAAQESATGHKTLVTSDVALLRSLLVIYLCLVLFVTPGSVARGVRTKVDIPSTLYSFFLWLLSLNSSIDWIVYGLLNTRFRTDYRKILVKVLQVCRLEACIREPDMTITES